jgi:hypothetical protein
MIGKQRIFNRQVEKVEKVLGRGKTFLPLFYFFYLFDFAVNFFSESPETV